MLRKLTAASVLVIACTPFARAQDRGLSFRALSLVDKACAQVMGLRRGETYFAACEDSLSHALPVGADTRRLTIAAADKDDIQAGKSFYEVAPSIRWRRVRYACAQMGFLPGGASFGRCVAGLDGAFLVGPN